MRVAKEGDATGGRGDLGVPQAGAFAVCCGGAIIIKKARRAAGQAGESSFFFPCLNSKHYRLGRCLKRLVNAH